MLRSVNGAKRTKKADHRLPAPEQWKIVFAGYIVRPEGENLNNDIRRLENFGA